MKRRASALLMLICLLPLSSVAIAQEGSKVSIDENGAMVVNGKKVFPIGFTMAPRPETTAPSGKPALQELRDAGALFMRTGPMGEKSSWDDKWMQEEQHWQDGAAKAGMFCCPWLKELSSIEPGNKEKEAKLRKVIERFKNHPGMGVWKGEDEPQWGKKAIPPLTHAYEIIHETDKNHPVWIVQAPRGTLADLKKYVGTYDIGGIDIYPVSYPPGTHAGPNYPNREISMVGEWTRLIAQVDEGSNKPFWMTLQIAFSGTVRQGNTLRFPTFEQSRFMAYQAIVNGARGLIYFGGNLPPSLSEQDKPLGWNWTFWGRVMRPLLAEIGDKSPLEPALVAPNASLQQKVTPRLAKEQKRALVPSEMTDKPAEGAAPSPRNADPEDGNAQRVGGAAPGGALGVEFLVREAGGDLYLIACKREGATVNVEFDGLPTNLGEGEVMFESPRKVQAKDGKFTDWFAPFDVHVYHFKRG